MRRLLTTLPLFLLLTIACTRPSAARDTTSCITPKCPDGKSVICTTYDAMTGQVRWREGSTCGGDHWQDPCAFTPVAASPGEKSDYVIEGKGWWIRYNVDAGGHLLAMWGRNASGAYWTADARQPRLF